MKKNILDDVLILLFVVFVFVVVVNVDARWIMKCKVR